MTEKYDDLDDLLEEFEEQEQTRILNLPPGIAATTAQREGPSKNDNTLLGESDKGGSTLTYEKAEFVKVAKASGTSRTSNCTLSDLANAGLKQEDDVAHQLKKGLDEVVSQMKSDPEAQKAFESLMKNLSLDVGEADPKQPPEKPLTFEDTIAQTMDRLQHDSIDNNDFLPRMLKDLEAAAGADGSGGIDSLLVGLMEELGSKEVLYEPMKEIHDQFPKWLDAHAADLPADELTRYKQQQRVVAQIVAKYEDVSYSDNDPVARRVITKLMEEMQATGAPPTDLVSDVSGLSPGAPGDCPVQ